MYNDPKDSILPADFDGIFKFTNHTDEDFVAKWNNIEYTFPANKTSPMIMNFTPVEIQSIRKKFARELAIREFYKTEKFRALNKHVEGGTPPTYNDSDLVQFIQKCLNPLEIATAKAKLGERLNLEKINSRDEQGELQTPVIDQKKSLIKEGSSVLKD